MDPAAHDGRRNADGATTSTAADAAAASGNAAPASTASAAAPGGQSSPEASPSKQRYGDVRAVLVEGIDGRW